jgi:anti-sigma B factor antagonist
MTVDIDVAACKATVSGCLDMRTAPLLVESVSALLDGRGGDIVLDLRSVTFLDAAGMSGFVQLVKRLRPRGRHLIIDAAPARINRLLVLAGLGGVAMGQPTAPTPY